MSMAALNAEKHVSASLNLTEIQQGAEASIRRVDAVCPSPETRFWRTERFIQWSLPGDSDNLVVCSLDEKYLRWVVDHVFLTA